MKLSFYMNPCASKNGIPLQVPCVSVKTVIRDYYRYLYIHCLHIVFLFVWVIITRFSTPGLRPAILNELCKLREKKNKQQNNGRNLGPNPGNRGEAWGFPSAFSRRHRPDAGLMTGHASA